MKVGAIIKAARQRRGLTLHELAVLIGSSTSTLSTVENDLQKNPISPAELVAISDATLDREMLHDYCFLCPVRSRIPIKKFQPMNNVLPGPHVAILKVMQELSEASNALEAMLPKMLRVNFVQDPDYLEFRNTTILEALDVKREVQTMLEEFERCGIVSADELRVLQDLQQRLCEQKGYHVPGKG